MTIPNYEQYDAIGLGELVQRGDVTPEELLESAIERLEVVNPKLVKFAADDVLKASSAYAVLRVLCAGWLQKARCGLSRASVPFC